MVVDHGFVAHETLKVFAVGNRGQVETPLAVLCFVGLGLLKPLVQRLDFSLVMGNEVFEGFTDRAAKLRIVVVDVLEAAKVGELGEV